MATVADITRVHSQRLSHLAQRRDQQLFAASVDRDRELRQVPATARAYRAFDDAVAAVAAGRRAEQDQVERSGPEPIEAAHRARRDADLAAFERRRSAEAAAEHRFLLALASAGARPSVDAQRTRTDDLERAKKEFDDALAASQETFRAAVDEALSAERHASTMSIGDAQRELVRQLDAVPAAAMVMGRWRQQVSAIVAEYRRAEDEEFERFHREMEALRRS